MKLFDFSQYDKQPLPVPSGQVIIATDDDEDLEHQNLDQYIEDRNIILIGIPGAFTPTCTEKHLPGFVRLEKDFYKKGIDEIICMSVNDPHVMLAFSQYVNHDGAKITMAADPYGEVAEQMGLLTDMGVLGKRCKRFAAVIHNGTIVKLLVDEKGIDVSTAENCLKQI